MFKNFWHDISVKTHDAGLYEVDKLVSGDVFGIAANALLFYSRTMSFKVSIFDNLFNSLVVKPVTPAEELGHGK